MFQERHWKKADVRFVESMKLAESCLRGPRHKLNYGPSGGDMPDSKSFISPRLTKHDLIHMARTTVAAVLSLLVARLFKLPESYWAAITTLVVMQSTLGAAFTISWHRFVGTALGAAAGGLLATYFGSNTLIFGLGVLILGMICAVLRLDRAAYRFASITLAITMLVASTNAAWIVAARRFFEVSLGIAVGLALTAIWPEASEDSGAPPS
jgi:uncharacterized membrane protein YccC